MMKVIKCDLCDAIYEPEYDADPFYGHAWGLHGELMDLCSVCNGSYVAWLKGKGYSYKGNTRFQVEPNGDEEVCVDADFFRLDMQTVLRQYDTGAPEYFLKMGSFAAKDVGDVYDQDNQPKMWGVAGRTPEDVGEFVKREVIKSFADLEQQETT